MLELLQFKNYSHSPSTLSPKAIEYLLTNIKIKKSVCILEIIRLIIMKMKMKLKDRSHRYVINRPRPRTEQKYNKSQVSQYDDVCMY